MRVKICGITNLEDAINAIEAGASALGFVFFKKSPRYISPSDALKIVHELPAFVQTVGLFVNEESSFINKTCKDAQMNLAQIIDDNSNTSLKDLDVKYLKVIRVQKREDLLGLENKYVLVDAFVPSFGGEGKRIDKSFFDRIDTSKMTLAGGLKSSNLKDIKDLNFYALDVSSGVELKPGKKDKEKMINFIKEANES